MNLDDDLDRNIASLAMQARNRISVPTQELEEFDPDAATIQLLERVDQIRNGDIQGDPYGDVSVAMNIAGVEIPATTPQEPPFHVRYIPADPNMTTTQLTKDRSGKFYATEMVPNPAYVSPETRAAALVRAEKELRRQQQQTTPLATSPSQMVTSPTVPPKIRYQMSSVPVTGNPTTLLEHANKIQQLLGPEYRVTAFALQDNLIVVTLDGDTP